MGLTSAISHYWFSKFCYFLSLCYLLQKHYKLSLLFTQSLMNAVSLVYFCFGMLFVCFLFFALSAVWSLFPLIFVLCFWVPSLCRPILSCFLSLSVFSSVQLLNHVWLFATPWTAARQTSLSITNSRSCSNSCPLSRWCHPTISSSVIHFSSCLQGLFQCFSASGSFTVNQFFISGGQSFGVSASTSVLPEKIQDWFPLGWTGWISLQCKGLSRVFSNTTVQKHQFFNTQLSL